MDGPQCGERKIVAFVNYECVIGIASAHHMSINMHQMPIWRLAMQKVKTINWRARARALDRIIPITYWNSNDGRVCVCEAAKRRRAPQCLKFNRRRQSNRVMAMGTDGMRVLQRKGKKFRFRGDHVRNNSFGAEIMTPRAWQYTDGRTAQGRHTSKWWLHRCRSVIVSKTSAQMHLLCASLRFRCSSFSRACNHDGTWFYRFSVIETFCPLKLATLWNDSPQSQTGTEVANEYRERDRFVSFFCP